VYVEHAAGTGVMVGEAKHLREVCLLLLGNHSATYLLISLVGH
jgi:hypothetical protein